MTGSPDSGKVINFRVSKLPFDMRAKRESRAFYNLQLSFQFPIVSDDDFNNLDTAFVKVNAIRQMLKCTVEHAMTGVSLAKHVKVIKKNWERLRDPG